MDEKCKTILEQISLLNTATLSPESMTKLNMIKQYLSAGGLDTALSTVLSAKAGDPFFVEVEKIFYKYN